MKIIVTIKYFRVKLRIFRLFHKFQFLNHCFREIFFIQILQFTIYVWEKMTMKIDKNATSMKTNKFSE